MNIHYANKGFCSVKTNMQERVWEFPKNQFKKEDFIL